MNIDLPLLIGVTISGMGLLYMVLRLNHISIKDNILKTIGVIITFGIYIYISYSISTYFIRYIIFLLFGSVVISRVYKINIIQALCTVFFAWILFLIAEIIFTIIVIGILQASAETYYGGLAGNILVCIIAILIFIIPIINNFLYNIINKITNFQNIMTVILLFILALSFSIVFYISSFNDNDVLNFTLSLIIIFTQIIITILLFAEKNNKQKVQYQCDSLLNNLEEYETMLDYQRMANHENKNQLLVIKGMVEKKDKNIIDYINSIIEEKSEKNESFLFHTNKIPSGGLKGLIYYKILLMKNKNIDVDINIDKSVRKVDFEKVGIGISKDLCKIVGVILDNAIEAVENLKDKKINITLNYKEGFLKIAIANNFSGKIDISNIEEKGYTTKGSGHGYGLSLVKELIKNNSKLENKKEIRTNVFIQNIILNCNN